MGETGEDRGLVGFRLIKQSALKIADPIHDFQDFVTQIETGVECDLIVPAARAVNACAFVAEKTDQFRFDVHVDVFEGDIVFDFSLFDHFLHIVEFGDDLFGGFPGDDPGGAQHCRMRFAAHDVVFIQPFVE